MTGPEPSGVGTGPGQVVEVDARGRPCPLPVLDLAGALAPLDVGSEVVVVADDPAAGPDIAAFCRMRGHAFVGTAAAADGTPSYRVRKVSGG